MILLDTNVISEFMRPQPDAGVRAWLDTIPRTQIWTSAIVVGELAAGIAVLPSGARRQRLAAALGEVAAGFDDRIVPFTTRTARVYGEVVAARTRVGRPISVADAQIAACARVAGLTVATRNVADFDGTGAAFLDPWNLPSR